MDHDQGDSGRDVSSPYLGHPKERDRDAGTDTHGSRAETARHTRRPAGKERVVEVQPARRTRTLGKAAGLPPSVEWTTDTTKATKYVVYCCTHRRLVIPWHRGYRIRVPTEADYRYPTLRVSCCFASLLFSLLHTSLPQHATRVEDELETAVLFLPVPVGRGRVGAGRSTPALHCASARDRTRRWRDEMMSGGDRDRDRDRKR